jgi:formylglycine-generating enzyme required for sulfatase activity
VYICVICGKRTVVREPQITQIKRMAQMSRNSISVEPGATPSTAAINVNQYTGTIAWKTSTGAAHSGNFAVSAVYQAEVSLAAKTGFTFAEIAADTFTYSGATVTHSAGTGTSLTVTITFPATDSVLPPSAGELKTLTLSEVSVNMRYVPAGKFQRNATAANVSVITKGYWLAETETTQELFNAVMESNPSSFSSSPAAGETQEKRPVEQVNWYHAIAFCNKLSIANSKQAVYSVKVSGTEVDWSSLTFAQIPTTNNTDWDAATMDTSKNGYRLPTEMEWMWAAMGADKTSQPNTTGYSKTYAGSVESGTTNIGNYAWYSSNSANKTHEAGKKTANELGLKDMTGNVDEWCWDWSGEIPSDEQTDFTGPVSGTYRRTCGGFWDSATSNCTVIFRGGGLPYVAGYDSGFRFACPAD